MWQRKKKAQTKTALNISYAICPAKTYQTVDGRTHLGRSVLDHSLIVGEVARAMIGRYPKILQDRLFPENAPLVSASHDLGKVSPCFVEKLRRACSEGACDIPGMNIDPALEKTWGGHAGVSQVAVMAMGAPQWVPEILGQHHGFSPQLAGKRADDEVFGGEAWQKERQALVEELKRRMGMDWPEIASVAQARVLAGLTTVADWIGSGQDFEDPSQDWVENIESALDAAGLMPPSYQNRLSFEQVFDFSPNSTQQQLMAVADRPGVYVLEAPMGLGKTEAALYAAYQILQSGHASGIYFALPTQLTSNKIHQRFNSFLERILATDSAHRRALLLHGKAWLLDTEMGEEGSPGGDWFNQAKRGLLAPFAVGTIDQALMAAMNVKHGFVRAFGLAGKVVILDEVHTYDAYTGTLLDALVDLLRGLQCTVIILSATLNQERRRDLLQADLRSQAYPLITALCDDQDAQELEVAPMPDKQMAISLLQDEQRAVQEVLDRACQGQQVLWIENTIDAAQLRYLDLAARARELGVDCGLLHSRFTVTDRQKIEDPWVDLFSKIGWSRRAEQGRILVGTQVLEQSLDIDADFLVSRFAPTDMLLQRMGRLWRHGETPRAESAVCEAWLLAPDLHNAVESPSSAFGSSAFVYSPYVLCRSLEVWQSRTEIALPGDIRQLIEDSYASREEQGQMARWLHELEHGTTGRSGRKGRLALRQLARIGLAQDGKTLPESQAQTRYSDSESYEVLLLRGVRFIDEKNVTRLTLLDGQTLELPLQHRRLSKVEWKQRTATLMQQVVPVRAADAPLPTSRDVLTKLGFQHSFYLGDSNWQEDESLLRVALVDDVGQLHGLNDAPVHARRLEYRDDIGYRTLKE